MKNQGGFIPIPILLVAVASVLVLGGGGYFGVVQYQIHQAENPSKSDKQASTTPQLSEIEKLRQEVDELKKGQHSSNTNAPSVKKEVTTTSTGVLGNTDLIKKVKPAVVYIKTSEGSGSGFVIEPNGYILTNAHVISGVNRADVTFSNSDYALATVVGRDELHDLALLKVNKNGLSIIKFGNSDEESLPQGENVFTFGFPFGLEGDVSFKEGTISRRIENYLETSAEIHPGNSGGPLINRYGQVVGINTAIYSSKQIEGVILGETIKFAIPVDIVKTWLPYLKQGKNTILPGSTTAYSSSCTYTENQKQNYLSFISTLSRGSDSMNKGIINGLFVYKKIGDIDIDGAHTDLENALTNFKIASKTFDSLPSLIPNNIPSSIAGVMSDVVKLRKEAIGYRIKEAESTLKFVEGLESSASDIYLKSLQEEEEKYTKLAKDLIVITVSKEKELETSGGSYFCE
ncbi:MAG: trypsin-like peptidase domain-containing protein [Candidatus Paceibacterota bacterium]|jgi:S1-C subfamily serine protease